MLTYSITPTDGIKVKSARFWIAGVPVDVLSRREIKRLFVHSVNNSEPVVLANLNLHGLYCALRAPPMKDLLCDSGTKVHIDGTPILWAAYLAGVAVPEKARNSHVDLVPELLLICAERGWSVVIVNSDERGAQANEAALSQLAPGLRIKGLPGYFELSDAKETSLQSHVISEIQKIRPALLLVGMGMPRQEIWIRSVKQLLEVPMIMPVGGFADYFAGRTRIPPRFLAPICLEWAYRLLLSPRRLGFRYLVEPFLLFRLLLSTTSRRNRWGLDASDRNNSNLTREP